MVDNAGDVVTEALSAGTDRVTSSVSYALGVNVENLTLTGTGTINATGNTLVNTLTGNSGNNVLNGGGGADALIGGLGNDIYVVDNAGDVVTEALNAGTDRVSSSVSHALGANVENLTLAGAGTINGTGNTLNNVIVGTTGNNVLNGGAGNDTLNGGSGNDQLSGGVGLDFFVFDSALNGTANVDAIVDFVSADDRIDLEGSVFTALGADGALSAAAFCAGSAAADSSDRIVYDQATGQLFYDSDGSGAGVSILFATVTAGTSVVSGDFWVG